MKNTSYLLNFLLPLVLISCGQYDRKNTKAMLQADGAIIEFQLDDQTPNVSMGMDYYSGLLFNINWAYNQLQIYDFASRKLIKNLNFEVEGDQGVGELFGFHVYNLDSIFLFSQMDPFIYLTDTSGFVRQKIRYQIPDGYSSAFVHPGYFLSPPELRSGELIVKTHFAGNYREVENATLKQMHMVYAINLSTGETRFLSHTYPEDYLANGLKHFEPSIARSKNKIVYSFFGDHRLFYAGSYDEKLSSMETASAFLDKNLKLFPLDGGRFETQQYLQASSRYESLVYDSYREVFYRFAYPTLEVSEENDVLRLRTAPGPFVIMVLDNDLNILGESYFEKGSYLPSNFFINEEGLFISLNHPDNPENSEEYFRFQKFSLEFLDN